MLPWTEQSGYPVVMVKVAKDRQSAILKQRRFLLNSETDSTLWTIPMNYAKSGDDFMNTAPSIYFRGEEIKITSLDATDRWIVFNVQQTGYYRVMYDEDSWNLIKAALRRENHDNIHYINRAQVRNLFE